MPGPQPAPRLRLTPTFRARTTDAMSLYGSANLSVLAGFPHPASFSVAVHASVLRGTPLMVARLRRLADLIGYRGELFEPASEHAEVGA